MLCFSHAGGEFPVQGARSDIRALALAVLADPKVPLSKLISTHGHCATYVRVIEILRTEAIVKRDVNVPHTGLRTNCMEPKGSIW